jgi:hypothetical protein
VVQRSDAREAGLSQSRWQPAQSAERRPDNSIGRLQHCSPHGWTADRGQQGVGPSPPRVTTPLAIILAEPWRTTHQATSRAHPFPGMCRWRSAMVLSLQAAASAWASC